MIKCHQHAPSLSKDSGLPHWVDYNLNNIEQKHIFTIGHSNRGLDEFVRILKRSGIGTVLDIRSYPRSKRNPQFDRKNLEALLPGFGIEYMWIKELGGLREGGYGEYMESPEFEEGMIQLRAAAEKSQCVFMCAELKWRECHRSFIAERLYRDGWEVVHLYDEREEERHAGLIGE